MENNSQKTAIKIKNSSNIRFINGQINGYNVGIDANNVRGLSMESVEVGTVPLSANPKLKWYKDSRFLAPIVVSIILTVIGWIFFTN